MSINLYKIKKYLDKKGFDTIARFKEPNGDIRNVSLDKYGGETIKKMNGNIMKDYRFVGWEYSSDGWRKYNIYTVFYPSIISNKHSIELKFIKKGYVINLEEDITPKIIEEIEEELQKKQDENESESDESESDTEDESESDTEDESELKKRRAEIAFKFLKEIDNLIYQSLRKV